MKVTTLHLPAVRPQTSSRRDGLMRAGAKGITVFRGGAKEFVEYAIGSNTLGIGNGASEWRPSPGGGSIALEVDDFAAAIAPLKEKGHPFRVEPLETPTWPSSPIRMEVP